MEFGACVDWRGLEGAMADGGHMCACHNQVHGAINQCPDDGLRCAIAFLSPSPPCLLATFRPWIHTGCVAILHNHVPAATECLYSPVLLQDGPAADGAGQQHHGGTAPGG
jgi:hypothetical protein